MTYCVGGLSMANTIAGAYAEKSPVVVISGSPGLRERTNDPLLHHKVKTFATQLEVFEKHHRLRRGLEDPDTAFSEIDRVLATCWRVQASRLHRAAARPVDVVPAYPVTVADPARPPRPGGSRGGARRGGGAICGAPSARSSWPTSRSIASAWTASSSPWPNDRHPDRATILGKCVISERHPLYPGVYEGAMGRDEVAAAVEGADCLLMLGSFLTDINLGIFTAKLDPARCIDATSENLRISHHHYDDVPLDDFLRELLAADAAAPSRRRSPDRKSPSLRLAPERPITVTRLFQLIDQRLEDDMAVVCRHRRRVSSAPPT